MKMTHIDRCAFFSALLLLCACAEKPLVMHGTIEWDRVSLPAPASEPMLEILVREGDEVEAGQILLRLDERSAKAKLNEAHYQVVQAEQALQVLQRGAREEDRRQVKQSLAAAQAKLRNADAQLRRTRELVGRQLVARANLDESQAAADAARAEQRAAQAAVDLLTNGSRPEDIAQAEAKIAALHNIEEDAQIALSRHSLRAPRAGRIDQLPYEQGDQAAMGTALVVMLVGKAPYARIYLPQPVRAKAKIGDALRIRVQGLDRDLTGRIRAIRAEPVYTPYYALTGEDASRLSYLTEVELSETSKDIGAGLPVQAEWIGESSAQ